MASGKNQLSHPGSLAMVPLTATMMTTLKGEPSETAPDLAKLCERRREAAIPCRDLAAAQATIDRLRIDRITKLPTELLNNIVTRVTTRTSTIGVYGDDHVSSEEHDRSRDIAMIKSLRLTSRRMKYVADRFLIHAVTVSMMPGSIVRLDEISRHPIFSKTVRCVRVNLSFYAEVFADLNNTATYENHQREQMRNRCILAKVQSLKEERSSELSHTTRALIDRLQNEGIIAVGNYNFKSYLGRLLDFSQKSYRKFYLEQQKVLKAHKSKTYPSFVAYVATAMARMPNATRLEMSDLEVPLDWKENYDQYGLCKLMTSPMRWEIANSIHNQWSGAPVNVLLRLPVALAKQGIRLTRLSVSVTPPRLEQWSELQPEENEVKEIQRLVQATRAVEFTMKSRDHDVVVAPAEWPRGQAHLAPIAAYLGAILSTSHLEKLHIGISAFERGILSPHDESMRWPSLSTVLKPQMWPKLRRLELDNVTITPNFLESLIGERSVDTILRLESILIERNQGNWHEMLNMLRLKSNPLRTRADGGSCGKVFVETLFAPCGYDIICSREWETGSIFGERETLDDTAAPSPALLYVRGLSSENPMPAAQ